MTLTDEEFDDVRGYLAAVAGLSFDDSRRSTLAGVLTDRLSTTGATDVTSYLAGLALESGGVERQRLLDAVTVQETQFFRNMPQIEALRQSVLPELVRRSASAGRPLTVWSAGCSTGEEPYTLAMLLLELSPALATPGRVRILGTDVSAGALRAAARATYAGRTLDAIPAPVADRWLEPRPGGTYGVKDQVRGLVDLRLHNLVTEAPPLPAGEVDLVVCRNVTIYFDRDTTARVIGSFHDVLGEGGYLLLGHSETLWQVSDAFTLVPVGEAFVYQRVGVARSGAEAAAGRRGGSEGRAHRARSRAGLGGAPRGPRRPSRPAVGSRSAGSDAVSGAELAHSASDPGDGGAVPATSRAAAAPPPTPGRREAEELLARARTEFAAGEYEAAARSATEASQADSLLVEAYVVLAESRAALGQDVVVVEPLRKAVYLDPGRAGAHFLLAGALSRLGQHAGAAVSYRAAARALEADEARHADFLGGRDAREMASLCLLLAAEAAARAGQPAGAGSGGVG